MVKKYSREPTNSRKAAKARGADLRVHYKNTFEVVRVIRKMNLSFAQRYLKDVLNHKRCIPFTFHNGHVGRTA